MYRNVLTVLLMLGFLQFLGGCTQESKTVKITIPIEPSTENEIQSFSGEAGFGSAKLFWSTSLKPNILVRIFRTEKGSTKRDKVYQGTEISFEENSLDFEKTYVYELEANLATGLWESFSRSVEIQPGFSVHAVSLLRVSDLQPGDNLGNKAIAIDGDVMVVGSYGEDGGAGDPKPDSGSAYVFTREKTGQWEQTQILRPSSLIAGEKFGINVAIKNDLLTVSSLWKENDKVYGGVYVYQFVNSQWEFKQLLIAGDRLEGDQFGNKVIVTANQIIVGAQSADVVGVNARTNVGSVYIFSKSDSDWVQSQKISAPHPLDDGFFGAALAASDQYLLVGSPLSKGGVNHDLPIAGTAYLYEKNTLGEWVMITELIGSDLEFDDSFGAGVAMVGDRIAIGALADDGNPQTDGADNYGAIYVFEKSNGTWSESAIIRQAKPIKGNYLGWYLAMSEDYIVAGTPFDDIAGEIDAGSVSVYAKGDNGWVLLEKLSSVQAKAADQLGYSVALSGNSLVIGAPGQDAIGAQNADTGAVYIYELR